jgi:hypothetical protein
MARRPLLPERMTYALSFIASLLVWLGATSAADAVGLSDAAATGVGIVLGVLALLVIPIALGRPSAGVILFAAVGGLAVVIGFVNQMDTLGLGVALAIFLPAAVILVLVSRLLWRRLGVTGQQPVR